MAFVVEQSRAIPVGVQDAFAGTLPLPLPTLFRRWYGPIPPIKAVRGQTGDWAAVGQTRTPAGTGTEVTWRWIIHPRSALATPALPVLGRLWRGYARRALEELSTRLVG